MTSFSKLLKPEVQEFIKAHENDDIASLVLKGSPFKNVDIQWIAQQIKGRQVAKQKLPHLYKINNIVYPPKLNLEQASSQFTAKYKSSIVGNNISLIDLTGGLGIDTIAFTSKTNEVTYCEIDSETFSYATHNFSLLKKDIKTYQTDGIQYLQLSTKKFDWLYLDPARRDCFHNKVFQLQDCMPNVLDHINLFKSTSNQMMIKISPLFDINLSLKQLPDISEIYIIAYKNEVKELLLILDFKNDIKHIKVKAVNLGADHKTFTNNYQDLTLTQDLSLPSKYLYEPNAAIMKSGFYGALCQTYGVTALAVNSHLFTSEKLINFPGRRFKIHNVISAKKKELYKYLPSKQANISTRNYPLKPQQIKKKYKLKDGGSNFVFFTENIKKEKIVLICEKIKES